jgi:S1-C subfamily serine protease
VDTNGHVVGLSNWTDSMESTFSGGLNAYMASRHVAQFLRNPIDRKPKRWLGVLGYAVLSGVEALRLGSSSSHGLVVYTLEKGGPLDRMGKIQIDDIILDIDGVKLGVYDSEFSPTRVLHFLEHTEQVTVRILRGTEMITLVVKTPTFPKEHDYVFSAVF